MLDSMYTHHRRTHALIVAAALLAVTAGLPAQTQQPATQQPHQHGTPTQTGQPDSGMMAKCQAMMAQHKAAMAEQQQADERLDTLVATMTRASGQQKTDAVAAVVTEMVTQRKAMHERMLKMQRGMMTHMAEHMQSGGSPMCPMMKP